MEPRDIENPIAEEDFRHQLRKEKKGNTMLSNVVSGAYNERPKDRPDCPNCKKQLSPAGGALDGSAMFWACWDCDYRVDDIPSHCL